MASVFVSYSNKDRDFVERLVADLDARGHDVFYDQRIPPGESWADSLARAIESAAFVLVVLSPRSVESPWVLQECAIALSREIDAQARVIPLLIEPCKVPALLAGKTYASFDRDYAVGLQRVLQVLQGRPQDGFATAPASAGAVARIRSDVEHFKAAAPGANAPPRAAATGPLRCFVVMPFGDRNLQDLYTYYMKPTLEERCGLLVERGDDPFGSNVVMDDIRSSIDAADFIVADLTGRNANVFYEVGICHALEKPVLLLAQSMEDVPFDLRHRRILLYSITPGGCRQLEGALRDQALAMAAKLGRGAAAAG